MKQQSLASQGVFEKYGRKSRRELFLEEMERVVPWSALESLVRPHYAKAGNGRQPAGLSIMASATATATTTTTADPLRDDNKRGNGNGESVCKSNCRYLSG